MKDRLTKREEKLAEGSIYDVAERRNERPEDIIAEADVIVLLDESGSMHGRKHEVAVENLRLLQRKFPGRVLLGSFSSVAKWHFNGLPSSPAGGTNMDRALDLAFDFGQIEDTKIYLISDGQPTMGSGPRALEIARQYKAPINTIFIGSDTDYHGQEFLMKLAKASGGENKRKVDVGDMEETVTKLLTSGGN